MTENELSKLENLPLIPLDFAKNAVTLTRLKKSSKVVVRALDEDQLEKRVTDVLKDLGVMVMDCCPSFLLSHRVALKTFVKPPTVRGVLQAMHVTSTERDRGMLSAILVGKDPEEKRALRNFFAKATHFDSKEKDLLLCLPLFEKLGSSEEFVSQKEVLNAAPEDACEFPVTPRRDFIGTKDEDARRMVRLLGITILTPSNFLLTGVFPDVKKGRYSDEEIDRLMDFVMKRYDFLADGCTRFEEEMKALSFVPTKKGRVRAVDLFNPRNDRLQDVFVDEDVFPTGTQYNDPSVLLVLEKLGMKSEDKISAQDLYQSALKVPQIPDMLTAKRKSKAILGCLERKPMKFQQNVDEQPLGELLREVPWVCRVTKKPDSFPKSLRFWDEAKEESKFCKPTEVTSKENVNLIGTVKPIVDAESSSQVAKYFAWDKKPGALHVVKHLEMVIRCYKQKEKRRYMLVLEKTYSFLFTADQTDVIEALKEITNTRWIWNGDGFSSPSTILAERPSLDLSPYISFLPSEMKQYHGLFLKLGMKKACDELVFLRVLHLMKEKYDRKENQFDSVDVKRDLRLSINILNEIKPRNGERLPSELQEQILIPTYVEDDDFVKLKPFEDCVYREGEFIPPESDDEDREYFFVHRDVPSSTAELLNVRTLTNRILDPEELGEEFGQEEKLTDRLNRLLEDYTDGFAVAKELIQNADDAGATEVRFLYDERTNETSMTYLIDKGMKGCQGPALWVYNDAVFRDEDFVNITKLNGGTKESETEKIGKFGLGFNAVYNLTDVPMFLSRNYFVVFDPHTFYLGKAIRNKPGMRIDINKNTRLLRDFRDQFKPFDGIFGCDLEKGDNCFQGTLFRFPLRTREQAARSEIKELYYSDQEMREFLEMFLDRAKLLLMFTQNVICVEIYRLPRSSCQAPQPTLLFQVNKSISQCGIVRPLSVPVTLPTTAEKLDAEQQRLLTQCNFLQACSKIKKYAATHDLNPKEFPKSSIAVNIKCSLTDPGLKFFNVDEHRRHECGTWLVVSSMGNGEAMQFAKSGPSFLPSAGIAVELVSKTSDKFLPLPIIKKTDGVDLNGTIFCYLPLPIHSGLPVHINGAFAVTSNRRHLQEQLEDDKACIGVKWNSMLMEDSISSTYISLLEDVKSLVPDDDSYAFHLLWPRASKVMPGCLPILTSFYKKLATEAHSLFFDGNEWVSFTQVVFLHPDLRTDSDIGEASFAVFQHLAKIEDVVIDLPADVFQSFQLCGLGALIESKTYDKNRFFCELFFPNISNIQSDLRDVLVLHAIDHNSNDFDELIKKHACIPASPGGKIPKRPNQLVNPKKEVASLFGPNDGRFPCGEDTFLRTVRLEKLEQLGMMSDDLPWEDIAERAESVQRLHTVDSKAAFKRVKALLKFIERKMKSQSEDPLQPILNRLLEAQFLPVLQKPDSFPLSWKGDDFWERRKPLVAAKDIFLKGNKYLVCCAEPLADREIPKKVKDLLKLEDKEVTKEHVMRQLEEAISTKTDTLDCNGFEELHRVCTAAYSFLQDKMANCGSSLEKFLLNKRFILVGKRFFSTNHVAFEAKADCSPYLNKLPEDLSARYYEIFELGGVRKQFEAKDYISGLQEVQREFGEEQLDERTLQVAVNMAHQLGDTLEGSCGDSSQEKCGNLYLPDSGGVMRYVADLCFKDCPWIPDDPTEHFVHEKIPWSICKKVGVKTRREGALQHHDVGFPFGQKEKLTNRLKRILTGYPGEKEILKELLQNADDAQATEICFVKDPRKHPDKKVFDDRWKPLQGPALCVYNNKPFKNTDIQGICNLGEGSKGEDPNKTGQYGVGFNAVYHLTDVPSFISKGEEIGDVLCVFDPHCKYVPLSTNENPGRMYKGIKTLKEKFPDVFSGYLEQHFPIKNATMFRFPLKSKKMAEESKISQIPVTVQKLDSMMKELKKELFEVLLFVNNVKNISISAVNESGHLGESYSVQVVMTPKDENKRQELSQYLREVGKQVKEKNVLPTNIKVKKCTYTMKIRDNLGMEEKWLVVQQVGFEKPIDQSIVNAFKTNQLGMLPRGGVACLLESNKPGSRLQGRKKAYCFLPLPFETELPVHINGHFALDHETRRYLWRDDASGYRSDWNNALLRDVIASCYLTLLDEVREFIKLPVTQDATYFNATHDENTISQRLSTYEKLFPVRPIEDPHWRTLANSVYREMDERKMRLMPVVRGVRTRYSGRSKESSRSQKVQLTWFPPTGTGKEKTFFNNLEVKGCFAVLPRRRDEEEEEQKRREENRITQKTKFQETLVETGFNLVAFSLALFDSFREAEVDICCVSPSGVMEFYRSFSEADPLCNVGAIPCDVANTPFKNQEGVIRVLEYCKDDEHFLQNLSGLPLLLTQDNCLNAFSGSDPKCLSQYNDILPNSPSIFVHKALRCQVFNSVDCLTSPVFRPLDVEIFTSQLHLTLPPHFCSEDRYMRWMPNDHPAAALPNRRWIYRVWDFLQAFVCDAMKEKDMSEENRVAFIRHLLLPLSPWSILPASETSNFQTLQLQASMYNQQTGLDHMLVPLKKAESVIDFSDCGMSSQRLVAILRGLGLPELTSAVSTTMSTGAVLKRASYELARDLVATLKTPHSLVMVLKQKLLSNSHSFDDKIKPSDAVVVVDYFSSNTESLTAIDKETLRKLPFYPTASGGLANLEGDKVFVLSPEIPKNEIHVVESILNCLFLDSRRSLIDLYDFLEVERVTPVEVYMGFVLKCFPHLSFDGRLAHLRYLRQWVCLTNIYEKEEEASEKERLLQRLKNVEFLPTKGGTLKTASSFYDPQNEVFCSMLSEHRFPPKPFASDEWLPFLKKVGLVQDVSENEFLTFATQVASDAEKAQTEKTVEQSHVLVRHLISRPNVVDEGLLHRVRDIPFVAAVPVKERLQALCPPYAQKKEDDIPFVSFKGAVVSDYEEIVWTKAHLLPPWADPRTRRYELGCPHRVKIDHYLNDFLARLQVVKKPSVDLVTKHCQNLCFHLENNNDKEKVPREQRLTVSAVMEHIYKFLQDNAMTDSTSKTLLQRTCCILVEEGKKFILPSQTVLELYEHLQIKPFLYRLPPEFGKFRLLFDYLGCSKYVKTAHYAMVLDMLQKNCHNAKLHPNEVAICSRAVKGLFDKLQDVDEDMSSIPKLYLPAMPPGCAPSNELLETIPVTLRQSTELVFDDAPTYGERIQGFNHPLVLELKLMDVGCRSSMTNYADLMMKLPTALQPKMLSFVVKEKLRNPESTVIVASRAVNALKQQLSSVQFARGIARIIRDVNSHRKGFDESVTVGIEKRLRNIELCAVKRLETSLFHNGILIPGSEAEVPYFQEKREVSGDDAWKLYLSTEAGMDETISCTSLVTNVIVEMYGESLGKKAFVISDMLRCSPGSIWSLLDRMGIRKDDSYIAAETDIFPEPGTLIPIEDHHLLNDAFEEFEPGEYVGYQLDDPSLDLKRGVATYIYAIIIEEVVNEDAVGLTEKYKINIGHDKEPEVVSAVKLHKFHRAKEIFDEKTGSLRKKNEIFDEISKMLKEAWKLPEEEKRQIIKRLCLRWHPEKNLGDEEFYRETLQHIQREVSRLGGTYDDLFASFEERAREHASQRQKYKESFSRKYGSWGSSSGNKSWRNVPPSFCERNRQPGEAKRWFRQAEADLEAGANEIAFSRPSYEWACFKCHQVKEMHDFFVLLKQLRDVFQYVKPIKVKSGSDGGFCCFVFFLWCRK